MSLGATTPSGSIGPAFAPGTVGLFTGYGRGRGLLDQIPAADMASSLAMIDDFGFSAVWIPEAIGREVLSHAAMLLSQHESLSIATGVASIYARDAVAANAASRFLNEAFPDRFLLGLGVSHRPAVEGLRGHEYTSPIAAMRGYLDRMDSALYRASQPDIAPPRVLAAMGDKMLALSAARGAGAHPYFVPPAHTAHARALLGPDALLAPGLAVYLDDDVERGLAAINEYTTFYLGLENYRNSLIRLGFDPASFDDGGSADLVRSIVAIGDEAAINARIDEHFAAGATHVPIQVLQADHTDRGMDAIARIAEVVDVRGRNRRAAQVVTRA